ncbi:MAG: GIY-YIG nuclease family protein [Bacteroidales bacterium]|nr:GIY-YIG nuclease family protein [Bacteroidales bacterium]
MFITPTSSNNAYVYLIEEIGSGIFKIGFSQCPENRLANLQSGNPHELKLVQKFLTSNPKELEASLHQYFMPFQVKDEWFKLACDAKAEFPAICAGLERVISRTAVPHGITVPQSIPTIAGNPSTKPWIVLSGVIVPGGFSEKPTATDKCKTGFLNFVTEKQKGGATVISGSVEFRFSAFASDLGQEYDLLAPNKAVAISGKPVACSFTNKRGERIDRVEIKVKSVAAAINGSGK